MLDDRRRELSAIATALVAHLLFLVLAPKAPLIEGEPLAHVDFDADTTIDIDQPEPATPSAVNEALKPSAPAPAPPSEPAAQTSPGVTTPGALAPAAPAPAAPSEPPEEADPAPDKPAPAQAAPDKPAESEPGPEKPAPVAPPASDEYGTPPPADPGGGVPGLGGPLWSIPGVVPSGNAPKPAPTTITAAPTVPGDIASRVLSGTLHTRDKASGIDVPGAGVVAGTVADAMRGSALTDVKGTFEVKLSASGNVESVRFVGSTDGDASQWAAVAENVRKSLAGRSLQMGADKQGVTVVVKVESKVQYPAGSKEKIVAQPVCANEVIEQMAAAIEGVMQPGGGVRGIRDDTGRFIPYSELDEENRRRFCIPIGIRGKGDVSNIGAHMTNVVSTSFQVKRAGEQALPADAAMPVDRGAPWLPVAEGKTRPPPPPPKKKGKKKRDKRGSVVPVQLSK